MAKVWTECHTLRHPKSLIFLPPKRPIFHLLDFQKLFCTCIACLNFCYLEFNINYCWGIYKTKDWGNNNWNEVNLQWKEFLFEQDAILINKSLNFSLQEAHNYISIGLMCEFCCYHLPWSGWASLVSPFLPLFVFLWVLVSPFGSPLQMGKVLEVKKHEKSLDLCCCTSYLLFFVKIVVAKRH